MKNIMDKIILITIDVTIGKYIVKFPFLITMSPGNFPINVQTNPIMTNKIPITIKSLPNFIIPHALLCQNAGML